MGSGLSGVRIVGVGLMLFSAILLGVGIHHMVATGTCSSTGYSANYGPVPTCPSGTGWWFLFLFGGIIGSVAGALMAASLGLVFAAVFGAIGFGSLTILLDAHTRGGEKVFAGVFGGCFAIVGTVAGAFVLTSAISSLRGGRTRSASQPRPSRAPHPNPVASAASAFGTPDAASAFGSSEQHDDPILSAYAASRGSTPAASAPTARPAPSPNGMRTPSVSDLLPGLQAAVTRGAKPDPVAELTKLAELHRSGALTDAEFTAAKAKLLGQA